MRKAKLNFIFIACFLTIAGYTAMNLFSFSTINTLINSNSETVAKLVLSNLKSEFDLAVSKGINYSNAIARNKHLISELKNESLYEESKISSRISSHLESLTTNLEIDSVFLISSKSMRFFNNKGLFKILNPVNVPKDRWYTDFLAKNVYQDPNIDTDENNKDSFTLFINTRINDRYGELVGVGGVGIRCSRIVDIIKSYSAKYNTQILLIEPDGEIKLDTSKPNENLLDETLEKSEIQLLKKAIPDEISYFVDKDHNYTAGTYLKSIGWYLVMRSKEQYSQEYSSLLMKNIATAVIIILLMVILIFRTLYRERRIMMNRASIDYLTGLNNRQTFEEKLNFYLDDNGTGSLFIIDLDNFKPVNDKLGHPVGDLLLKEIAHRIKNVFLTEHNIIGRLGGDEFIVFVKELNDIYAIKQKAEELNSIGRVTYEESHGGKIHVSISIGIARMNADCRSYKDLYKNADIALYKSKEDGRNRYTIFG